MSKDLEPVAFIPSHWLAFLLPSGLILHRRTSSGLRPVCPSCQTRRHDSRIVTMQPSKIFETVLYAEDLAAAERFYHEALGWK